MEALVKLGIRRGIQRRDRLVVGPQSRVLPYLIWGLLFGLTGIWSAALPVSAGVDESAHVINAASDVRGQIFKPGAELYSGTVEAFPATVPKTYTDGFLAPCGSAFKPDSIIPTSAKACYSPPGASAQEVRTWTYVGQYQPFYYFIVGLPSLLTTSTAGIYLMRLVNAALTCLFLAMALTAALRYAVRSLLASAVLVSMTPVVLLMAGTVQPNAVETAAAISMWTAGITLARTPNPATPLVRSFGISGCALALVRPLSPVWTVVIFVLVGMVAGRDRLTALLACPAMRRWLAAIMVCLGLSAAWILGAHGLSGGFSVPFDWVPTGTANVTTFAKILGATSLELGQMVGPVAWAAGGLSQVTLILWIAMTVCLAGLALVRSQERRITLAWVSTAVLVVLLPPTIATVGSVTNHWAVWYGRYTLPLAVGMILIAGAVVTAEPREQYRVIRALVVLAVIGQIVAYMIESSLFVTGAPNIVGIFETRVGAWNPPLLPVIGFALFLELSGLLGWLILSLTKPGRGQRPDEAALLPAA